MEWYGLDSYGTEQGLVASSCEHCIKPCGYRQCLGILERLRNSRIQLHVDHTSIWATVTNLGNTDVRSSVLKRHQ
jgi:hypothetical protein